MPTGGTTTPLTKRNTVEAKDRKNFLTTSGRRIKSAPGKDSAFGGSEGKQRNTACPFNGRRQQPLMMRTVTCDSAGRHFPPLGHKLCESPNIFIVDPECLVGAESTNLAPKHRPSKRSASLVF